MSVRNMRTASDRSVVRSIRKIASPLLERPDNYDHLLEMVGDARIVVLGMATQGSHEFYRERAQITKYLIRDKGFTAVAVDSNWSDAYCIDHSIRALPGNGKLIEAFTDRRPFPGWLCGNAVVLEFADWLREYNQSTGKSTVKVGFYGLDLFDWNSSIEMMLSFLNEADPRAELRAKERLSCLDRCGAGHPGHVHNLELGLSRSLEHSLISHLANRRRSIANHVMLAEANSSHDHPFYSGVFPRLLRHAESYYRAMFRGDATSWNLRDQHLADTLESLVMSLRRRVIVPKIAVWAHNSHAGNARATEMATMGKWNLGQLLRDRYGRHMFAVGLTTYVGSVTASAAWGSPPYTISIRPALSGSYESLFHDVGFDRFLLRLTGEDRLLGLRMPRLERAIHAVYEPENERAEHYFLASLPSQFHAVIHIDRTSEIVPTEQAADWS